MNEPIRADKDRSDTPKTDSAQFHSHALGAQDQLVVTAGFARTLERYWNNVCAALPVPVGGKWRGGCGWFYGGYWLVKRSHAEREIAAAVSATRTAAAEPLLPELCKELGWQGGTIHQVLEEIKRLKRELAEARTAAADWTKFSLAAGETPQGIVCRGLRDIANLDPIMTVSAQEIARNSLAAADALEAEARNQASAGADRSREQELDRANTELATESANLRGLLSELVEACDGCDNMDQQDGDEFWAAQNRLDKAVEAARPLTEKALIASAIQPTGTDRS